MINLNKHQTKISLLKVGSKLIVENIVENNIEYENDIIYGKLIVDEILEVKVKLWMRHLLNESEIEGGESMLNWINKLQNNFPDEFEVMGHNIDNGNIILKPHFK